jgi:hypothetical protein
MRVLSVTLFLRFVKHQERLAVDFRLNGCCCRPLCSPTAGFGVYRRLGRFARNEYSLRTAATTYLQFFRRLALPAPQSGGTLLTEFEVRRRMADIATSAESPLTKVRRLLRLGQRLRAQAASLDGARTLSKQTDDANAKAHLARMSAKAKLLEEDLRAEAQNALGAIYKN